LFPPRYIHTYIHTTRRSKKDMKKKVAQTQEANK
jgi:hypothetical protein